MLDRGDALTEVVVGTGDRAKIIPTSSRPANRRCSSAEREVRVDDKSCAAGPAGEWWGSRRDRPTADTQRTAMQRACSTTEPNYNSHSDNNSRPFVLHSLGTAKSHGKGAVCPSVSGSRPG